MDGGDVVDSDTRPPKILDNGDGDGEGPDQLLNKQNSSEMCSANVANNAENDGEEGEETEIGTGGGGVDFINVSRSGDGGGSCVVLDKSEQNISELGRNSVVNGNNGFHDKYLNGSVDSGEHSDGAPAQINYAEPASVLSPAPRHQEDILIPTNSFTTDLSDITADHHQEVIAISDDEDGDPPFPPSQSSYLDQRFLDAPSTSSRPPLVPHNIPMSFPRLPMPPPMSSMPPPPPLRPMYPRNFSVPGPNDVITLSDDEDDDSTTVNSNSKKRKRSSRKRGTMFNPQICPFCYKPKRENICMSQHLIRHHWSRIRAQNMGNSKSTDYANIKDDREIPVEKYKEERMPLRRSPPMSHYPPPPPMSGHMSRSGLVEQPLRPSFLGHARGAFGRPPAVSSPPFPSGPGASGSGHSFRGGGGLGRASSSLAPPEESKSLGQEVAEELGHPSNRQLVKAQLGMLMHAHKCAARGSLRKQNSFFQDHEKPCSLPDCAATKELLRHLPTCRLETECAVPKCFMSKQIVKWALSPESPEMLRDTRSEFHRQATAGLPREVVEWATRNKAAPRQQWDSWREPRAALPSGTISNISNTHPPSDISNNRTEETNLRVNNEDIAAPINKDIPNLTKNARTEGITTNDANNAPAQGDWKMKYLKAREKMKDNQKAQKMRNGPGQKTASVEDKIVPSQASADILSSLLSAQSEVADLRKGRKPPAAADSGDKAAPASKKVPKLVPAPVIESGAVNGEDAATFNSLFL